MKNKKFIKAIAAITLSASAALGAFGLAACGHTHNFSEWENSDPNQHWKVCPDDGEEEPGSRANHDFTNGDCVCGAKKPAYTATFKNGETVVSTATAGADGKVAKPEDPKPADSTKRFNGWKTEGGALFDFNTALTSDVTLVADWRTVDNLDLLVEAGGVLYQNRFNEAATVDFVDEAPASGLYGMLSGDYAQNENAAENLKLGISGGKLNLNDVGKGAVNAYIKVETQTLKKIHIYAELEPKDNASKWNLMTVLDGEGKAIAYIRADGDKKVGLSLDNSTIYTPGVECSGVIAVELTLDLGTGKISGKIKGTPVEFVAAAEGTPAVTEGDITATTFGGLNFITANGSKATDTRNISLDNVGIRAEESAVTLAELQTKLKTALTAKYTAYGVETNYTHNGADLTAAHTAGLAAIEAAETNETVLKAYNDALAAMAAVESDAAIALKEAKEAAKTALNGYKNAADYTINGEALTAAVNAGKAAIEGCTTTEAVTAAETAAKSAIDNVKSDATLLSEKQTAAKAELAAYKDASNYTYESNKAAYDKAIEDGNTAIEGVTIGAEGAQAALTAVDTALANAKAELDKVDTNETVEQNASLAEVKAANKLELETYAENKKKADEGDAIIAGVIDAELAKGIAAIDAITEDTAEGKAAVIKACDDAKTAINDAVTAKKEETYTVTLSVTGVQTPETLQVIYGGTITAPAAPKPADGKLFDGWYTAETEGSKFDFATKIYENTTIYAQFVDIPNFDDTSDAYFLERANIVFFDNFSAYEEGYKLPTYSAEKPYVFSSVEENGAVIVKKGEDAQAATHSPNGAANVNMRVGLGALSGVIESMYTFSVDAMGGNWQLLQIGYDSNKLIALNTAKSGDLSLVVAGSNVDSALIANAATIKTNTVYTVYVKIDLTAKTLTIAINNKAFISGYSLEISSVDYINFVSSNSGGRKTTINTIFVAGEVDAAAHKQLLASTFEAAATGVLESAEITELKNAILNADSVSIAGSEYYGGLIAIKEAKAAKALAEAKTAALAEIEAQYPADNYHNSTEAYNAALNLVRNAITVEEVATKKAEALATISALPDDNAVTYVITVNFIGDGATQASLKDGATSATTITVAEDATLDTIKSWVQLSGTTYEITGLFKDSEGTTPFAVTDIANGATVYVKVEEKATNIQTVGFTQSDIDADFMTKINAQISKENTNTIDEYGIIKLVYDGDLSSGSHKNGGTYINVGQIGKANRHVKIDLSNYTGKATVSLTGFSSTAGREMFITTTAPNISVEASTENKISTVSTGPVTGSFELDCGNVYYVKASATVYLCGVTVTLDLNAVKA